MNIHTFDNQMNCTADTDLLKMVPVEILLNFGNYFRTLQLGLILKISFRNSVSSVLSMHIKTFIFTGPFDLTKAQSL